MKEDRNNIPIKITKHAQSCFVLEKEDMKILIDPGYFVFGDEGLKPQDFDGTNIILITHEHEDHFDLENIKEIIRQNDSLTISTKEVIGQIKATMPSAKTLVLENQHRTEINEDDWTIFAYKSKHGPLPTGKTPPDVIGFLISDGESSFYHPGDTTFLNHDVPSVSGIAVPICGEVVMNPKEAIDELDKFIKEVDPFVHCIIPIHYDNPRFPVDVKEFEKLASKKNIQVRILEWGQSTEL